MFYHHKTIQTYVGALLNLFKDLEVQYENSSGNIVSRNIPINFAIREKNNILDDYTTEQLLSGNTNVLPRANISWSAMVKAENRTTNKNVKVNTKANENNFEFLYNSVPYEFMFELSILCRGMNEVSMIIEQIASRFNPIINIDVYDATNLNSPTRIPVSLLDIGVNNDDFEELSSNIVSINVGLSVKGNMYPPIKTIERIKDFKLTISETKDNIETEHNIAQEKIKKSVLDGNVIEMKLQDLKLTIPEESDIKPKVIEIIEIVSNNIILGENNLTCLWSDVDSTVRELEFEWDILFGDAYIKNIDKDKALIEVNNPGDIEVFVKVTDEEGNYSSMSRVFTVQEVVVPEPELEIDEP